MVKEVVSDTLLCAGELLQLAQKRSILQVNLDRSSNTLFLELPLQDSIVYNSVALLDRAIKGNSVDSKCKEEFQRIIHTLQLLKVPYSNVHYIGEFICAICQAGGYEGQDNYFQHLKGHINDVNAMFVTGIQKSASSKNNFKISCPVCPGVMTSLGQLQGHMGECIDRINQEIKKYKKPDIIKSKVGEHVCDKCYKSFAISFAFKQHSKKCKPVVEPVDADVLANIKRTESTDVLLSQNPSETTRVLEDVKPVIDAGEVLYKYPMTVVNAKYRCLPCATAFESEDKEKGHHCPLKFFTNEVENFDDSLNCKLCTAKYQMRCNNTLDLKCHYVWAHYQRFFEKWGKIKQLPSPCIKGDCDANLEDLRQASHHYGVDHDKLYKALDNEKKRDMSDVMQLLFPEIWSKNQDTESVVSESTTNLTMSPGGSLTHEEIADGENMVVIETPKHTSTQVRNKRIRGLLCPICHKKPSESIKIHISMHYKAKILERYPAKMVGKQFHCQKCPKKFDRVNAKNNYARHVGAVHEVFKEFCAENNVDISMILSPNQALTKRPINTGQSPQFQPREIKCRECDKNFGTEEQKKLHTCNSIMDQNIAAEGAGRINRASSFVNNDQEEEEDEEPKRVLAKRVRDKSSHDNHQHHDDSDNISEEPLVKTRKQEDSATKFSDESDGDDIGAANNITEDSLHEDSSDSDDGSANNGAANPDDYDDDDDLNKCHFCQKSFGDHNDLSNHILTEHIPDDSAISAIFDD